MIYIVCSCLSSFLLTIFFNVFQKNNKSFSNISNIPSLQTPKLKNNNNNNKNVNLNRNLNNNYDIKKETKNNINLD
jgi:uncharacterized protein YsxB (DUF464 family)